MSSKLPNYLRTHRKRLSLSQDEVAFLLGTRGGAKVCRYERFVRDPNLETALAYEVIFRTSVRELFAGLYEKIEKDTAARAKALAFRKVYKTPNQENARKLQALTRISQASVKPHNQ